MSGARTGSSQDPRAGITPVDRQILAELATDGRCSVAELARRVGIAESTCSGRLRALRASGALRGVHADIDHAVLGRPIQAMVAVRFAGHERDQLDTFRERIVAVPGVIAAYHVTGADDYLVHVAVATPHDLSDFVLDHLTSIPRVAHAESSLIFDRFPGRAPLG